MKELIELLCSKNRGEAEIGEFLVRCCRNHVVFINNSRVIKVKKEDLRSYLKEAK